MSFAADVLTTDKTKMSFCARGLSAGKGLMSSAASVLPSDKKKMSFCVKGLSAGRGLMPFAARVLRTGKSAEPFDGMALMLSNLVSMK